MSKSKIQRLHAQHTQGDVAAPHGKFRFGYGDGPFIAYVRQLDGPRCDTVSYPIKRIYEDGTVVSIPWTEESLITALVKTAQKYHEAYAGQWVIEIEERPAKAGTPYRGPNPLANKGAILKPVPPLPPAPRLPNWDSLKRLGEPTDASKAGPTRFDPETDSALDPNDRPRHREPGEDG